MKGFSRHWATGFASTVGVVSAVVALSPVKMTAVVGTVALVASAIAAGYFALRNMRPPPPGLPPVDHVAPSEESVLHWPCDQNLARQANALANRSYGGEAIPFDYYEQWRAKNPEILVCVANRQREVRGYFDILPVTDSAMERFVRGELLESKLNHEDLCTPAAAVDCRRLYLAGIAVKDPSRYADQRNATILMWAMVKYLRHFYARDDSERELFALASTPEGTNLIHNFNFTLACPAAGRQDQHDLYKMIFSRTSLDGMLSTISNWAGVVSLPWEATGVHTPGARAGAPRRPTRSRTRRRVLKAGNGKGTVPGP